MSFETPNYKVQAGFYKDKLIGLKTLDTVRKVFPDAFLLKKTNDPMSGFFILKKEVFLRSKNKLYNSGFKILFDIFKVAI